MEEILEIILKIGEKSKKVFENVFEPIFYK